MRVIALLAPILAALGVISSLQAEEKVIIKDKSPDKKFALRMTHSEEGWDTVDRRVGDVRKKCFDLEVGRTVGRQETRLGLERVTRQNQSRDYGKEAKLIWSKRFAASRLLQFEDRR